MLKKNIYSMPFIIVAAVGAGNLIINPEPQLNAVTQEVRPLIYRLELPVSWQMTRARFAGAETSTQTESYRETWYLELGQNGETTVVSRRAKVEVYRAGALKDAERIPPAIVLAELDFARLLGLLPPTLHPTQQDPSLAQSGQAGRNAKDLPRPFITLALSREKNVPSDLKLKISEDEHFSIHYELSGVQLKAVNGESAASP